MARGPDGALALLRTSSVPSRKAPAAAMGRRKRREGKAGKVDLESYLLD
jgi:hypothetical protein